MSGFSNTIQIRGWHKRDILSPATMNDDDFTPRANAFTQLGEIGAGSSI